MTPGPHNDITDVAGIRVGHVHRRTRGWLTGTTVVVCPPGSTGGVAVRGGAPGTRETDTMAPDNLIVGPDALCLTGGSAYGLAAADGVMAWLAEHDRGFRIDDTPGHVVPIVPAAVIFDLNRGGRFDAIPDATFGYRATAAARQSAVQLGAVGAGTGARAGGLKGGVGSASITVDGFTVAALMVVNPVGSLLNETTGRLWGADTLLAADGQVGRAARSELAHGRRRLAGVTPGLNTIIGVIATDAALTKAECQRFASVAHDGLAIAVRPVHTLADGDAIFSVATGTVAFGDLRVTQLNALLGVTAHTVARAITRAVLLAQSAGNMPSCRELYPSMFIS